MATFSTNQNRNLYVVNAVGDPTAQDAKVGTIQFKSTPEGEIFGVYLGAGGITRTDLIKVKNIRWSKGSTYADLRRGLQKWEVSLNDQLNDGDVIGKQEYILRFTLREYGAMTPESYINKYGYVYATTGMSTSDFYKAMLASLKQAFKNSEIEYFTFKLDNDSTPTKIIIQEVEQPWVLGTRSSDPIYTQIDTAIVTAEDGESSHWGIVKKVASDTFVNDGHKMADLEYFCMGERGDFYRNMRWPYVIHTQYLVDPSKEYNVVDMHHFFQGEGVDNQASEKDITFVVPAEGDTAAAKIVLANSLITAINTATGETTVKALVAPAQRMAARSEKAESTVEEVPANQDE